MARALHLTYVTVVSVDDGDLAPATGALTVWDSETGGTQITDLQDTSGLAVSTVTPVGGRVRFFDADGQKRTVWLDNGSGVREPSNPVRTTDWPSGAAGPEGPAGATGPAGAAGAQGPEGQGGYTLLKFRQEGEVAAAIGLQPEVLPVDMSVGAVVATVTDAPTSAAIVPDITADGVSIFAAGGYPSIGVGKRVGSGTLSSDALVIPGMTDLRMNVRSVGDSSGTSVNPALKGSVSYTSGAVGNATSFAIPTTGYTAPGGGSVSIAAGDLMIIQISSSATVTPVTGGAATALVADLAATSLHGAIFLRTATGTADDAVAFSLSVFAPYSGTVTLISNPGATEGLLTSIRTDGATTGTATSGTSLTGTGLTTTGANQIGMSFVFVKTNNALAPTDLTISGGWAPTKLQYATTTRGATNNNFGALVAYKSLPTAGAQTAATYTTSPSTTVQVASAVLSIKSGVSAGTPGKNLMVTLWLREYVDPGLGS